MCFWFIGCYLHRPWHLRVGRWVSTNWWWFSGSMVIYWRVMWSKLREIIIFSGYIYIYGYRINHWQIRSRLVFHVGATMSFNTPCLLVYTTKKHIVKFGMVDDCFDHIVPKQKKTRTRVCIRRYGLQYTWSPRVYRHDWELTASHIKTCYNNFPRSYELMPGMMVEQGTTEWEFRHGNCIWGGFTDHLVGYILHIYIYV